MLTAVLVSSIAAPAAPARCPHRPAVAPLGPHHRRNCSHAGGRLGVVNGEFVTDPAEFPFVAACGDAGDSYDRFYCGGTLVHPEWVLTAAHCLDPPVVTPYTAPDTMKSVRIQLRLLDVDAAPHNVVRRGLASPWAVPHPEYNERCLTSDIALLRLDAPVHDIAPVMLGGDFDAEGGEDATLVGWGSTDVDCRQYDSRLQKGAMHIGTPHQCYTELGYEQERMELCAGQHLHGREWIEAGCGDSGGPLFVSKGGNYVQVGVVSWGYGWTYNGYGRVSHFADWIHRTIAEHSVVVGNRTV